MYSAYEELLAFNDIDEAVDKLFRAYLDLKLLELASERRTEDEYWRGVLEFRKERLDPFTVSRDQRMLEARDLETAKAKLEEHREVFERSRAYLYWFDVRADFWAKHRPDPAMPQLLAPAAALEQLHLDASALQKRLEVADKVDSERRAGSSGAGSAARERAGRASRGTPERRGGNPLLEWVVDAKKNGRERQPDGS